MSMGKATIIDALEKTIELYKKRGNKATNILIESINNELNNENELICNTIIDAVCQSFRIYKSSLLQSNDNGRRTSETVEALAICCIFFKKYWTTNITTISQKVNMEGKIHKDYLRRLMKKYNKEELQLYADKIPMYKDLLSKYENAETKIIKNLKTSKL